MSVFGSNSGFATIAGALPIGWAATGGRGGKKTFCEYITKSAIRDDAFKKG